MLPVTLAPIDLFLIGGVFATFTAYMIHIQLRWLNEILDAYDPAPTE